VPVRVLVGADDRLIKKLYLQPLQAVRPDWKVVEIEGGGHLNTILKPQFREEIAAWLKPN
jgi:pimeloyl-ACP methyl ester carboxylesterase